MDGSTEEPIGRKPSRRVYIDKGGWKNNGHYRSPPLEDKIVQGRDRHGAQMPSTKATSSASPTGSDPDEDRMMRWTHYRRRSK